jgi:hypothetical protein
MPVIPAFRRLRQSQPGLYSETLSQKTKNSQTILDLHPSYPTGQNLVTWLHLANEKLENVIFILVTLCLGKTQEFYLEEKKVERKK